MASRAGDDVDETEDDRSTTVCVNHEQTGQPAAAAAEPQSSTETTTTALPLGDRCDAGTYCRYQQCFIEFQHCAIDTEHVWQRVLGSG